MKKTLSLVMKWVKQNEIKIGQYVAVEYDNGWYPGLFVEKQNEKFTIKFIFQDWFANTWLKIVEMRLWLLQEHCLNVKINTNNSVEIQNRTVKYDFLTRYTYIYIKL